MQILQSRVIAALIFCLITSTSEARNRVVTYIDDNGARRVQKTGKIYRDYAAVREFKRANPKPDDFNAYDIDHIKPLSQGGADKPYNMRWIKTVDHRRKTASEK